MYVTCPQSHTGEWKNDLFPMWLPSAQMTASGSLQRVQPNPRSSQVSQPSKNSHWISLLEFWDTIQRSDPLRSVTHGQEWDERNIRQETAKKGGRDTSFEVKQTQDGAPAPALSHWESLKQVVGVFLVQFVSFLICKMGIIVPPL